MPKVGKKHFDYSVKGIGKAKAAAKKSGKPMKMHKGMMKLSDVYK